MSDLNQIYDAYTDTWSLGTPLPHSSMVHAPADATTGVNALKRIYVFGGDETQVYDPKSDSWTFGADIPTDRVGFGVAVVNDTLFVIGGFTETFDIFWNSHITLYATNEQYTPFGYGTPDPSYDGAAPEITVVSPENKTYYTADVTLNFTANEPVFSVHYELDGETAVEISGNTTIAGLAIGVHNITVSAVDASGNMGASETISFTVAKEPEPFPTTLVAVASAVSVSVVGLGFLFYFKRSRTKNNRADNK